MAHGLAAERQVADVQIADLEREQHAARLKVGGSDRVSHPEALRLAVADARARAEAAAAGAGRAIDRVIKVEDVRESGSPVPRPMMAMARAADAPATPIEPGLIEIHARVTLTAAMR